MIKRSLELYKNLVHYILPNRCLVCHTLTQEENSICAKCWTNLNFITRPYCHLCCKAFAFDISEDDKLICGGCLSKPPKYDQLRSILNFDPYSKRLIHAFKYYDKTSYAKLFSKLLINRYRDEVVDIDYITPVPMHRLKRLYRYYNPPQLLAQELAIILNKPIIPDMLIKHKWTKSQTGLSQKDRKKNLSSTIKFNPKYQIRGKKILLIDDVHTTGETCNLCSSILKKQGAERVQVMTIATT